MEPVIITAASGILGALIGGGAAIVAANNTLNKQLEAQESKHRKEQLGRAHQAVSKIAREGSLIHSTAAMRGESAREFDVNWLSDKAQIDEFRAVADLYMGGLSGMSEELYGLLTKFWYEHSMALSVKQEGHDIPQTFYEKVVPISEQIQEICKSIKKEIVDEL